MADIPAAAVPVEEVGAHGCKRTFRFRGWTFETLKAAAIGTEERLHLSNKCELPHIPLPEIVFGANYLCLTHEASGWTVSFNAQDALMTWARRQRQDVHSSLTSYDVMYTCEYEGTTSEVLPDHLLHEARLKSHKQCKIVPTNDDIPLDKLREHSTILFYDHVSLLEDDIRDLGEVEVLVKIRVMPFGFLVLCRYFGRIDDKTIKLRDSRYYHEFDSGVVLRDFEMRETTAAALHHIHAAAHKHEAGDDSHRAHFVPTADFVYTNTTPISRTAHKIQLHPGHAVGHGTVH